MARRTRRPERLRRAARGGPGLPEGPPRAQDGATEVVVGRGRLAELHEEQVHPRGKLDRRRQLDRVVLHAGAEAPAVDVDRALGDGPTVQLATLYARYGNPPHNAVPHVSPPT